MPHFVNGSAVGGHHRVGVHEKPAINLYERSRRRKRICTVAMHCASKPLNCFILDKCRYV
jgi:hypothetical protein